MYRPLSYLGLLWISLHLAACTGGSPATAYYTLVSDTPRTVTVSTKPIKSIGLSRVLIPDSLQRTQMILRQDAVSVEVSDDHQWVGDLRDELTGALVRQLQMRLPKTRIQTAPWELEQTPQYEFSLHVTQFDGAPTGSAYLTGRWQLLHGRSNQLVESGVLDMTRKVQGTKVSDLVAAQNALVTELAAIWVAALPPK